MSLKLKSPTSEEAMAEAFADEKFAASVAATPTKRPVAAPPEILDSDLANSDRLVLQYGDDLRHVRGRGWYVWNGLKWELDHGKVMGIAKNVARAIHREASDVAVGGNSKQADCLWKWAKRSQQSERIRAMLFLAESEAQIAANADDFDRDPMLLACNNCVLDLRTGFPKEADRMDLISASIPVDFDSDANAPHWVDFLDQIMDGDAEMVEFMRRAVGYSLTGRVDEQCMFFLYGHGRNGKSTFVSTVSELFGEFHRRTSAETIMMRRGGAGIPNDLAALRTARMVSVSEVCDGHRLDESKIKDMTGGDIMTARFLHGEFFDFKPQFKLWLAGNHKPRIAGTDEGIWRRIRLIPFAVTIPESQVDPSLPGKMKEELPGILNWALQGCLDWQCGGCKPPALVTQATAEFRSACDTIGQWIEECGVEGSRFEATAKSLMASYEAWAAASGERPMSARRLGEALAERGYERGRNGKGIFWRGIGVRHE